MVFSFGGFLRSDAVVNYFRLRETVIPEKPGKPLSFLLADIDHDQFFHHVLHPCIQ